MDLRTQQVRTDRACTTGGSTRVNHSGKSAEQHELTRFRSLIAPTLDEGGFCFSIHDSLSTILSSQLR
jgi:hypothetical protein